MLHDFIIDIFSAIVNIFLGSFLFPLKGWGERYGESVSKIMCYKSISFKIVSRLEFLKVTIPPIPK